MEYPEVTHVHVHKLQSALATLGAADFDLSPHARAKIPFRATKATLWRSKSILRPPIEAHVGRLVITHETVQSSVHFVTDAKIRQYVPGMVVSKLPPYARRTYSSRRPIE